MAKYKLTAPTFINNSLYKEGDVVDYDGKPGSTLQPVTEEGDEAPARGRGRKRAEQAEGEPSDGQA